MCTFRTLWLKFFFVILFGFCSHNSIYRCFNLPLICYCTERVQVLHAFHGYFQFREYNSIDIHCFQRFFLEIFYFLFLLLWLFWQLDFVCARSIDFDFDSRKNVDFVIARLRVVWIFFLIILLIFLLLSILKYCV